MSEPQVPQPQVPQPQVSQPPTDMDIIQSVLFRKFMEGYGLAIDEFIKTMSTVIGDGQVLKILNAMLMKVATDAIMYPKIRDWVAAQTNTEQEIEIEIPEAETADEQPVTANEKPTTTETYAE